MNLSNSSTALFVKDIEASKDFYCGTLGLEIALDFGKNVVFKSGFALWEIQNEHIIQSELGLEKIGNPSVNRFELYFETENLEEVFQALKARNVPFLHAIHEEPWGQRTIRFFDPDHHLVEVGESMGIFVRRFFDQELTIEQVSNRTSVPVEEIRRLLNCK